MPPLSEIAAIILAAGLSSRFEAGPEETKLVVPLCGKPLVRHVAEAALASRAHPIFVVTGHGFSPAEGRLPRYLDLSFYLRGVPFNLSSNLLAALEGALDQVGRERHQKIARAAE